MSGHQRRLPKELLKPYFVEHPNGDVWELQEKYWNPAATIGEESIDYAFFTYMNEDATEQYLAHCSAKQIIPAICHAIYTISPRLPRLVRGFNEVGAGSGNVESRAAGRTRSAIAPSAGRSIIKFLNVDLDLRSFTYDASGARVSDAAGSPVLGEQYDGGSRLGDLEKRSQARRRQVGVSRLDRP
jgi:hypothetical protein